MICMICMICMYVCMYVCSLARACQLEPSRCAIHSGAVAVSCGRPGGMAVISLQVGDYVEFVTYDSAWTPSPIRAPTGDGARSPVRPGRTSRCSPTPACRDRW